MHGKVAMFHPVWVFRNREPFNSTQPCRLYNK